LVCCIDPENTDERWLADRTGECIKNVDSLNKKVKKLLFAEYTTHNRICQPGGVRMQIYFIIATECDK